MALSGIRFYQLFIGPLLMPSCRYYPTCSNYAKEAFLSQRFDRAFFLVSRRICSCHPLGGHGYDPVPKE